MAPYTLTWGDRVFRALLPSFLADVAYPNGKVISPIHRTSYLDGLRGIASIIVFFCHYTEDNHKYLVPSYGLNREDGPSALIQLPFLRIIYSGRPMVHIFFFYLGLRAFLQAHFKRFTHAKWTSASRYFPRRCSGVPSASSCLP